MPHPIVGGEYWEEGGEGREGGREGGREKGGRREGGRKGEKRRKETVKAHSTHHRPWRLISLQNLPFPLKGFQHCPVNPLSQ